MLDVKTRPTVLMRRDVVFLAHLNSNGSVTGLNSYGKNCQTMKKPNNVPNGMLATIVAKLGARKLANYAHCRESFHHQLATRKLGSRKTGSM